MSHFSFQSSPTQRLSNLKLRVGEEAQRIVWKADAPGDDVHSNFFVQSPTLVFEDEMTPSFLPQNTYRSFELTGKTTGTGQFRALEILRKDGRLLGEIDI